jgi:hypothetical protein
MLIAALAFALLAPQDPQVVDGVIVRPQWVETPTVEQLAPQADRTEYNPSGTIELICVVVEGGALDDCRLNTFPVAYPELGRAAFAASEHFRHATRLENGRPAAGLKVRLRITWRIPE